MAPLSKGKILGCQLELWQSSRDYVLNGIPWWERICMKILSPNAYNTLMARAKENTMYARGIYDRATNKVVICLDDLSLSVMADFKATAARGKIIDDSLLFSIQFYYTLIHELLHSVDVAGKGCEHKIDFDKYEKLPMWLKVIFDDFLKVAGGDSFKEHNK